MYIYIGGAYIGGAIGGGRRGWGVGGGGGNLMNIFPYWISIYMYVCMYICSSHQSALVPGSQSAVPGYQSALVPGYQSVVVRCLNLVAFPIKFVANPIKHERRSHQWSCWFGFAVVLAILTITVASVSGIVLKKTKNIYVYIYIYVIIPCSEGWYRSLLILSVPFREWAL